MIEVDLNGVRKLLVEAMSGWSEQEYAAGWMQGLTDRIRMMANSDQPEWMVLAYLAEGWPSIDTTVTPTKPDGSGYVPLHERMTWEPLSIFEMTTAREFIVRSVTRGPKDDQKPERNNH